jgi:protease-4
MNFIKNIFKGINSVFEFISNYFKVFVFLLIVVLIFSPEQKSLEVANLEKITLTGAIFDASEILEKLHKAKNAKNIKGILVVVDSPGGAVAPSIEIAHAIKETQKIKPVVVYASGMFTSGAYYSAIWADEIVANPGTIVGSIGVIFQSANVKELLDRVGVKSQNITAGKYKEIGTPLRAWNKHESDELKKVTKATYEMFVKDVATARKLPLSKQSSFADAHIFDAQEAMRVGLVDKVATLSYAKDITTKLSGVKDPRWKKEDKVDKFLNSILNQGATILPSLRSGMVSQF